MTYRYRYYYHYYYCHYYYDIIVPGLSVSKSLNVAQGDSTLISLEVLPEPPYLAPLASFSSDHPHQGFSFLSKTICDVRKVEFARAWRLSKASLEPISFRVPRVKVTDPVPTPVFCAASESLFLKFRWNTSKMTSSPRHVT